MVEVADLLRSAGGPPGRGGAGDDRRATAGWHGSAGVGGIRPRRRIGPGRRPSRSGRPNPRLAPVHARHVGHDLANRCGAIGVSFVRCPLSVEGPGFRSGVPAAGPPPATRNARGRCRPAPDRPARRDGPAGPDGNGRRTRAIRRAGRGCPGRTGPSVRRRRAGRTAVAVGPKRLENRSAPNPPRRLSP